MNNIWILELYIIKSTQKWSKTGLLYEIYMHIMMKKILIAICLFLVLQCTRHVNANDVQVFYWVEELTQNENYLFAIPIIAMFDSYIVLNFYINN